MPSERVIQLRQQLAEKIPHLRLLSDNLPTNQPARWRTGVASLDAMLDGGLPKSRVTEVIAPQSASGSALLSVQLLREAARQNQFTALIDGCDSFDAAAAEQSALDRLLWVRCKTASEAVKATDMILRDGNLQLILLDLALNSEKELRKIPAPTWYRFQRIVEESNATFVVFTPQAMVSPAEARVSVRLNLGLDALEASHETLAAALEFDLLKSAETSAQVRLRQTA